MRNFVVSGLAWVLVLFVIFIGLFISGIVLTTVANIFFDLEYVPTALIFSSFGTAIIGVIALAAGVHKLEIGYVEVDSEEDDK